MTITAKDSAGAANYLATLKVLTLNGNEGAVWADYLNTTCPNINATDLHQATRLAVSAWADLRRSYQIDIEHIHQAVKRIHAERIKNANIQPPRGLENEPQLELTWLRTVRDQIAVGQTLEAAERTAWQAIGRTPPRPALQMTFAEYQQLTGEPQ